MSFYHIDIIISSNKAIQLFILFLGPSPPLFNVSSFKGENSSAAIQIYLQVMLFKIHLIRGCLIDKNAFGAVYN